MSRFTDAVQVPRTGEPPPLPVVDWMRIGHSAPVPLTLPYGGPQAPLPAADTVVLTWTSAEWSALDQVFLDSATTRTPGSREWERSWRLYSFNVGANTTDNRYNPLWGYFRVVQIGAAGGAQRTVLLFKCGAHLAHPPWLAGLAEMVAQILAETGASWVYSIGTAGGTRPEVRLGDVVITNAADIKLEKADNAGSPIVGQSFACPAGVPTPGTLGEAQQHLFFGLGEAVNYPVLERLLHRLQIEQPEAGQLVLQDLLNDALRPERLRNPAALPMPGTPLLTTDYYYIASGAEAQRWAALEMDDAVIGWVVGQHDARYLFVRNISDPLVPDATAGGEQIPDAVRDAWSSLIYEDFGLYTSFNGALATWALIAGEGAG
jgi:nucleoside phosphorylase